MVAYGQVDGDESKVRALNIWRSRNVWMQDVLVRNSNSWAIHIYETDGFHANNVKVFSGKEGFDPDASRDVLIENVFVQSYDDALVVKARSRNPGQITERVAITALSLRTEAGASRKFTR